jgi:hypothetical protein
VRRAQRDDSLNLAASPAPTTSAAAATDAGDETTLPSTPSEAIKANRASRRIDPASLPDPLAGVPFEDRKGRPLNVIQRARIYQGRESSLGTWAILAALVGYVLFYFLAMPDQVGDRTADKLADGTYPLIDNAYKTPVWLAVNVLMFLGIAAVARYGNRVSATITGLGGLFVLSSTIPFGYIPMMFGMWMMFRYSKTKQLLRLRNEWPTRKNRAQGVGQAAPRTASATKAGQGAIARAPKPSARYTPPKQAATSARRRRG